MCFFPLIETITEWNNCTKDSDCKIHENAICDTSGKCICKRAYFVPSTNANKLCIPGKLNIAKYLILVWDVSLSKLTRFLRIELGQPCKNDDVPIIKNSICKNDIWTCINTKVASKNNQECLKGKFIFKHIWIRSTFYYRNSIDILATRKYNSSCQYDEHCSIFGPDAICKNKRCLCNNERSHFVEELQFCWSNRGINERCKANEDCYVEGLNGTLVCTTNVCNCSEGTHLNSNGTACINSNAGKFKMYFDRCTKVSSTTFLFTDRLTFLFTFISELGMFCEFDEHCTTLHSVCTNNVCTCDKTYYELKKKCYPGKQSLDYSNLQW